MALQEEQPLHSHPCPRQRVKQLSSISALQDPYSQRDDECLCTTELTTYQSFTDLRKLLEEECAEIERKEREAKASLEARIRRRHSDSLSASDTGSETNGTGLIGSLRRLIDPLMPVLGGSSGSGSSRRDSASM